MRGELVIGRIDGQSTVAIEHDDDNVNFVVDVRFDTRSGSRCAKLTLRSSPPRGSSGRRRRRDRGARFVEGNGWSWRVEPLIAHRLLPIRFDRIVRRGRSRKCLDLDLMAQEQGGLDEPSVPQRQSASERTVAA